MSIKVPLFKNGAEPIVTGLVVKHYVTAGFVKAMEWRLTTSDTTVLGDSRTYQLVWLLASKIAHVNLIVK